MKKSLVILTLAATGLAACTTGSYQTDRQLQCAGGMLGGAAVGGILGNQVGGGKGKQAATAVGAGAGALAGTQAGACQEVGAPNIMR